jgi:hypothetical protein
VASVFYASTDELATLSNTFTVDDVEADPTTVTLTVTTPSQTSTSYTYAASQITRSGTGAYSKDIACTEAGEWAYLWDGAGAATDVQAGTWTVWDTGLGKLYATVRALKSRVGIAQDDTADDEELHAACFAASRALEQFCQRTFWRTAAGTQRLFEPTGYRDLDFGPWNDLVTLTALATDEGGEGTWPTTWSATDYQLVPLNPTAGPESRPYTGLRTTGARLFPAVTGYGRTDRIRLTGTWGWPVVPQAIRQAALVVAAELFKAKDAPLGVVGFGDLGVVRLRENPLAARLSAPYRLAPVGVA